MHPGLHHLGGAAALVQAGRMGTDPLQKRRGDITPARRRVGRTVQGSFRGADREQGVDRALRAEHRHAEDLPVRGGDHVGIGLAHSSNRPQLYRRLLRRFADHAMQVEREFAAARADADPRAATRCMHNLKSNAGTLGALGVQRAAAELEAACGDEGDLAQQRIDALLPALTAELAIVLPALAQLETAGST